MRFATASTIHAALLASMTACGRIGYDPIDENVLDEHVYSSCNEVLQTRADAIDGRYRIEAGPNGEPIPAYCDLTDDDGGWMLVTPDMIFDEQSAWVTVVNAQDERGGLVLRVYANVYGCADPVDNVHRVAISDRPAWTQIRATYKFAGGNACWWIFGEVSTDISAHIDGKVIVSNIVPFQAGVDTIRDEVKMGGAGNAFDGLSFRCDNETTNFWHPDRGLEERSALLILRRSLDPGPAGLATTTSCTTSGPGTESPTWWEYSDISVR